MCGYLPRHGHVLHGTTVIEIKCVHQLYQQGYVARPHPDHLVYTLSAELTETRLACCVFRSPGALTFGYGCTVHVGVDVGAGDIEIDVICITFIMGVQYIGYLVPYKDKALVDNRTTGQLKYRVQY